MKKYELDTDDTYKTRLAASLGSLPKYLIGKASGGYKDFLKKIRKDASKNSDFSIFLEKYGKNIEELNINIGTDVLPIWLAYNTAIEELIQYNSLVLKEIGTSLVSAGYFSSLAVFTNFWGKMRESTKTKIEQAIKNNKLVSDKYTELYEKFDDVEERGYTDFKPERFFLEVSLGLTDIAILEVFNNIVTNENIPFSSCEQYYKILKDFIPKEDWGIQVERRPYEAKVEEEKDFLILKVNERILSTTPEFTDVKIKILPPKVDLPTKVILLTKLVTDRGNLTKEDFLARVQTAFPTQPLLYTEIKESEVAGVFFFPETRVNSYILSDLIMNNKIFSSLISIDESQKATKKKNEESQPWLYLHFNHSNTEDLTASVIQKTVDRASQEMKEQDAEIFSHGSPYVRVRAKGRTIKDIEFFQKIFAKLLELYFVEEKAVLDFYRGYIPNFGDIEEYIVKYKKRNTDLLVPDLFVENYSRNCPAHRIPTIINKEQVEEYEARNQQVMVFPRDADAGAEPRYPSDGKNQQYYVCDNPQQPFPGVRINKLENSDMYPYVPCCYKTDQKNKKGDRYRNYFFGEEISQKEKKQQEFIITNKILSPLKYGVLPEKLEKFFSMIQTDSLAKDKEYTFIRMGVDTGQSSFLACITTALTGSRKSLTRQNLTSHIPLAKQCMYDYTEKGIKSMIKNKEAYLDPKLFIQLLEGVYDCNIYLFSKDGITVPRHTQGYYTLHRPKPCVFVYENNGSESDRAKNPQCELIVLWNTKKSKDVQLSFTFEEKIARSVRALFAASNQSFALTNPIVPVVLDLAFFSSAVSQKVDSYGKCRQINFNFKGDMKTVFLSPIPPLNIPIEKQPAVYLSTVGEVKEMTGSLGEYSLGEQSGEITVFLGSVKARFPTQQAQPSQRSDGESLLTKFNSQRRLARYITEYVFWLFSRYLKENNIEEINDKTILSFAKARISVIENFSYGFSLAGSSPSEIGKNFSVNSPLMSGGKLVVQNNDMKMRVLYVLKLFSIRNLPSLLSYYTHTSISSYYVDISDFTQLPSQVILQGVGIIEKLIAELKKTLVLYTEIAIGINTPYFFKNSLVESVGGEARVFLAQNVDSLEKAISISVNWKKHGYNSGFHSDELKTQYPYTLYRYTSKDDIERYSVKGDSVGKDFGIAILGYKIGGIPFFTTLLGL